jgi:polysaccharide export outer membrane protein
MKKTNILFCLLISLFLTSCATKELRVQEHQLAADVPNPANPPGEFYVIGPGDVLGVVVWQEPSVSGTVKVRPDGFITLALINEIQAVGLTTAQLRETLQKKYKDFIKDPFVTISVQQIASSEIFLIGEVNSPGSYPAMGNDSILQLLTRAGGLNIFADRDDIRVVRRNGVKVTEYIVDYDAILKGDLKQDILLRPGDRVIVP